MKQRSAPWLPPKSPPAITTTPEASCQKSAHASPFARVFFPATLWRKTPDEIDDDRGGDAAPCCLQLCGEARSCGDGRRREVDQPVRRRQQERGREERGRAEILHLHEQQDGRQRVPLDHAVGKDPRA